MVDGNRGPQLNGVVIWMLSMAIVATVLRVYVRVRMVKAFGWDDAWIVFAMLMHIAFATCVIGGVHYGTGRHVIDLSNAGISKALQYWWLCYIAYCLTMIGAKMSIGLFLLRITPNKIHRVILYTIMTITVLSGLVFLFVTIFQCSPISFFWGQAIGQKGSCIDIYVIVGITYFYSVVSAICDFTFGLLPVFLVWKLNMSKNSKIALIPILSMGCIASLAVVVRMGFVKRFVTNEFLYDTVDIAIWSDIEQGLAITASSLATLRPLYRKATEYLNLSTSKKSPLAYDTPVFSDHTKRKPRGPFSLMTFTHHDGNDDQEQVLETCKPVKLRNDGVHDSTSQIFSSSSIRSAC